MFENTGHGLEATLIGVVGSSGENCSTTLVTPTLLANVGFYRKWIEEKIKTWTKENVGVFYPQKYLPKFQNEEY